LSVDEAPLRAREKIRRGRLRALARLERRRAARQQDQDGFTAFRRRMAVDACLTDVIGLLGQIDRLGLAAGSRTLASIRRVDNEGRILILVPHWAIQRVDLLEHISRSG
jgi:hypothetical protein